LKSSIIKTNLAAGPPGIILAITTVGNIDPQPLSTITIPNGSFFTLVTIAYSNKKTLVKIIRVNFFFSPLFDILSLQIDLILPRQFLVAQELLDNQYHV
jgi:hypothetical protein